jgi:hypothetical protein
MGHRLVYLPLIVQLTVKAASLAIRSYKARLDQSAAQTAKKPSLHTYRGCVNWHESVFLGRYSAKKRRLSQKVSFNPCLELRNNV